MENIFKEIDQLLEIDQWVQKGTISSIQPIIAYWLWVGYSDIGDSVRLILYFNKLVTFQSKKHSHHHLKYVTNILNLSPTSVNNIDSFCVSDPKEYQIWNQL